MLAEDFDLSLVGLSDGELDKLLAYVADEGGAKAGTGGTVPQVVIPEPPRNPPSRTGDLWILGDHRLLCGDNTSHPDVRRLMNGERAILFATDPPSLNCLSEGETLADLARRECAIGFDLRFCRSVAVSGDDREPVTCDPSETEVAMLYAQTDLGEAITNHDAHLTSAGVADVAAVARALFGATVNARRDPPDAAQRHQAARAALINPHWIN